MCVVLTERRNRPDPDDDRPGYPKHVICSFAHLHPRKSISSRPTSKFLTSRFTVEPIATAEQAIGFFEPYPSLVTRSEEHTSELQSLMRISYAVFCLKKKINIPHMSTSICDI